MKGRVAAMCALLELTDPLKHALFLPSLSSLQPAHVPKSKPGQPKGETLTRALPRSLPEAGLPRRRSAHSVWRCSARSIPRSAKHTGNPRGEKKARALPSETQISQCRSTQCICKPTPRLGAQKHHECSLQSVAAGALRPEGAVQVTVTWSPGEVSLNYDVSRTRVAEVHPKLRGLVPRQGFR